MSNINHNQFKLFEGFDEPKKPGDMTYDEWAGKHEDGAQSGQRITGRPRKRF